MGTWSSRRATGWYSTPDLTVNDHALVVKACQANSLTRHGGLHHRRNVSPAWQYVP